MSAGYSVKRRATSQPPPSSGTRSGFPWSVLHRRLPTKAYQTLQDGIYQIRAWLSIRADDLPFVVHSPSPSECFVAGVHKPRAPPTKCDRGRGDACWSSWSIHQSLRWIPSGGSSLLERLSGRALPFAFGTLLAFPQNAFLERHHLRLR